MWHVVMHLSVWMILDVMSTYWMLKCCVWDPLGLKQGGNLDETMLDMWFLAKLLNSAVQFSSHPFGNVYSRLPTHPHTLCPCQANGLVQRYRSPSETFAMISLLVHTPEEKVMGIGHSTCIQGFAKAGLFQVLTSVEIQSLEPSWKHRPVIPCLCTSVYFCLKFGSARLRVSGLLESHVMCPSPPSSWLCTLIEPNRDRLF